MFPLQVSQFSCDDEYVAAQVGCFQYFTGLTGTIQSYNYAGLAQIKGMNYKNCIRAEEGYCCIQVDNLNNDRFYHHGHDSMMWWPGRLTP